MSGVTAAAFAAGAAVAWVVRTKSGNLLGSSGDSAVHLTALRVKELVAQTTIVIFSKSYCPFCRKVKALFKELGIEAGDEMAVVELDVSTDGGSIQTALLDLTKQRTVPSVWIKGQHIGGFDDTSELFESGKLQAMLGLPNASPTNKLAAAKPAVPGQSPRSGTSFHVAYGAS